MYELIVTNKFKKDVRKCIRQQKNMLKFQVISEYLENGEALPAKNKDHNLSGNWGGHRECHIESDWLLIYQVNDDEKVIELVRMGSHSELFG